jgi:hypothetical protein
MVTDSKAPRGFAGLESLVSEVAVETPKPSIENFLPKDTRLISEKRERLVEPVRSMAGLYIGLGFFALIGAIVLIAQASSPKDSIVKMSVMPLSSDNYKPLPAKPVNTIEKRIYVLKGSDGSLLEVEAQPNATPALLNELGQSKWRPKVEIPVEELPQVGRGRLFNDSQIRYCLSQKVRLSGWQTSVDSYDRTSVSGFNAKVEDYNARCGHFQYEDGALERVQTQVQSRRAALEADGKLHRGPRQPEKTPSFKLAIVPRQ